MKNLDQQLKQIESFFSKMEVTNPKISKVTVGWHLDHSLRVINSIIQTLETSNPREFKSSFSFLQFVFMTFNFLPRGKAKAPKRVQPNEETTLVFLNKSMALAYVNIEKLSTLPKNAHFAHPYFGKLNLKQSKKFLRIHTKHHLKIVEEMLIDNG